MAQTFTLPSFFAGALRAHYTADRTLHSSSESSERSPKVSCEAARIQHAAHGRTAHDGIVLRIHIHRMLPCCRIARRLRLRLRTRRLTHTLNVIVLLRGGSMVAAQAFTLLRF